MGVAEYEGVRLQSLIVGQSFQADMIVSENSMPFLVSGKSRRDCDGITRRQALKIGASGFLGGLTLPRLLQMEATAGTGQEPRARACIFLFLQGGPSTIDMWDLKPAAPAEIRGPYRPIRTNVPGTFVGEHCHRCARVADKFT